MKAFTLYPTIPGTSVYLSDSNGSPLSFHPVDHESMALIWHYLKQEKSRTTDFSYGGLLMWVDYFNYRYCVVNDTLFIKGLVEDDRTKAAYSLPVGKMSLEESIELLKLHCQSKGWQLELSAVPESAVETLMSCGATQVQELTNWGDYIYSAESLATLSGKKMSKKRNRFNKFEAENPGWSLSPLTPDNVEIALQILDQIESTSDFSETAHSERELTRKVLNYIKEGDNVLEGAILHNGEIPCAFTIGDVKEDTLFIHIEKALREIPGSFEAVNKSFAEMILGRHPEVKYINREDDAGDPGLRIAKESYHPLEILKKYNVVF